MQPDSKRRKPSVAHAWTCWLTKTLLREHKIWLWGKDQNCSVGGTHVWRTHESDRRQRYWHYTGSLLTSHKLHSVAAGSAEPELLNTWTHEWLCGQRVTISNSCVKGVVETTRERKQGLASCYNMKHDLGDNYNFHVSLWSFSWNCACINSENWSWMHLIMESKWQFN